MIHNVIFLQRRFPEHAGSIIRVLTLLSLSGLVIGLGIMLLN
jgi:hypothetical protein